MHFPHNHVTAHDCKWASSLQRINTRQQIPLPCPHYFGSSLCHLKGVHFFIGHRTPCIKSSNLRSKPSKFGKLHPTIPPYKKIYVQLRTPLHGRGSWRSAPAAAGCLAVVFRSFSLLLRHIYGHFSDVATAKRNAFRGKF